MWKLLEAFNVTQAQFMATGYYESRRGYTRPKSGCLVHFRLGLYWGAKCILSVTKTPMFFSPLVIRQQMHKCMVVVLDSALVKRFRTYIFLRANSMINAQSAPIMDTNDRSSSFRKDV